MPRITELAGYRFVVADAAPIQDIDPKDGQPLFDGNGAPKMVGVKQLVFICPITGEQVLVSLPDRTRQELVKLLTGGIQIASTVQH